MSNFDEDNIQFAETILNATQKNINNAVAIERINYMHQVAQWMISRAPTARLENSDREPKCPTAVSWSRSMTASVPLLAQRMVFKLDPTMKRTYCRKCRMLLVPGETCRTRVTMDHVLITCTVCQYVKRLPMHPVHRVWSDIAPSRRVPVFTSNNAVQQS